LTIYRKLVMGISMVSGDFGWRFSQENQSIDGHTFWNNLHKLWTITGNIWQLSITKLFNIHLSVLLLWLINFYHCFIWDIFVELAFLRRVGKSLDRIKQRWKTPLRKCYQTWLFVIPEMPSTALL
jgi:hypothetical protein